MQVQLLSLPSLTLSMPKVSQSKQLPTKLLRLKPHSKCWFCNSSKVMFKSPTGVRYHGGLVGVRCEVAQQEDVDDGFYMRRCVELARKAIGRTSPNPMVGCVIVKDGKVVGEGLHPKAGQPHAEVFALRDAGELAENATAYVSLEPCNHYGRTPPCTEALIKSKVKKVVVGMVDPNPIVASRGLDRLRDAGIDVITGVEEKLCKRLNDAYIYHMVTGNPFVTVRLSTYIWSTLCQYGKHRLQTWVIPKYSLQYSLSWQNEAINRTIEDAILEAEQKGVKVISLGLFNQGEGLNSYGGIYLQRNPRLKIKVVDGSSLTVAVILNSIPKGTTQVLLIGNLTKVAYALAFSLCQRDIQVVTLHQGEYLKLTKSLNATESKVVHGRSYAKKIWLVGDGMSKKVQFSAPKGTIFVPFSQFPPKMLRRDDCFYHYTPAMKIPRSLENVYTCENWLPRRVMSVWRIAGIVHALEGWNEHVWLHLVQH